ncbi:hypothetical protein K461DRAFT_295385 [Myriangium duriaei CBS 260.36]|uniref:Bromodomain associated domain-containing protein n=1 Tax=Myriangium duriaei CBS 260.36 TaxID=1168546 RepID=A0A9P4J0Q1_9PEZI|nr:hypothetical protein K461DRAFT_295385 [Myriangium duriaei CBS 260.36]
MELPICAQVELHFRYLCAILRSLQHNEPATTITTLNSNRANSPRTMSTSTPTLHSAALRISVLHILRAAGFHSTRPSVLDALVNITERYLLLLASSTATHALANHNSTIPTITDVRLALTDAGVLLPPSATAAEDVWTERLRPSPADYEAMAFGALRQTLDDRRNDDADTADVRAFTEWIAGDKHREIRRVAGQLGDETPGATRVGGSARGALEDFLTLLKRRNKPVVDEERWAGTVLGRDAEDRELLIEGGEVGSVAEWGERLRERSKGRRKEDGPRDVEMEGVPG